MRLHWKSTCDGYKCVLESDDVVLTVTDYDKTTGKYLQDGCVMLFKDKDAELYIGWLRSYHHAILHLEALYFGESTDKVSQTPPQREI